jgi:hypothetical protein
LTAENLALFGQGFRTIDKALPQRFLVVHRYGPSLSIAPRPWWRRHRGRGTDLGRWRHIDSAIYAKFATVLISGRSLA